MKGKERFERRVIEELAVWEPEQLESLGKPDLSHS
jgi:hypothetical protein